MSPTLTLITICWNAAGTLKRTLDSILAQSALPLEYRMIDGGSSDGTLDILAEYQPRFAARGVAFSVEPQHRVPGEAGIPNAWNQALRQARGEVIAMINADDWYEPAALSSVLAAFADPAIDAVACPIQLHTASCGSHPLLRPHPWRTLPYLMPVPHPGCFFRRRVYERLGLYDTRYKISADYDFIWRCRQADIRWAFLAQPLVNMQLGGMANASRALARRETYLIARRHGAWYDPRPALAFLLRWITRR